MHCPAVILGGAYRLSQESLPVKTANPLNFPNGLYFFESMVRSSAPVDAKRLAIGLPHLLYFKVFRYQFRGAWFGILEFSALWLLAQGPGFTASGAGYESMVSRREVEVLFRE